MRCRYLTACLKQHPTTILPRQTHVKASNDRNSIVHPVRLKFRSTCLGRIQSPISESSVAQWHKFICILNFQSQHIHRRLLGTTYRQAQEIFTTSTQTIRPPYQLHLSPPYEMALNERGSASHARSLGITERATPLDFPWTGDMRVRCACMTLLHLYFLHANAML